jgi:hypothetical protein
MKVASAIIFLGAAKPLHAQSPCLTSFAISTNSCSYDKLLDGLQEKLDDVRCSHEAADELKALSGFGSTEEEAKDAIAQACAAAYMSYGDITEKGPVFDKEYFDGGTYYNGERESINENGITVNKLENEPGARIEVSDILRKCLWFLVRLISNHTQFETLILIYVPFRIFMITSLRRQGSHGRII